MDPAPTSPQSNTHPFTRSPHRTLVVLSIPVLFSMTAEPLTGLVDTAFIASLGEVSLAALGVGTTALSSLFWIFGFLGIGAQTEVAQADGGGHRDWAGRITSLALVLALGFGTLLILGLLPFLNQLAALLGASGEVQSLAVIYMQIRLFGAPAVLAMLVTFGALRGIQDMRTPLWIALGVNALNVVLDWLLIFGYGAIPPLGVAGSAWASTIAQWLGALWGVGVVARRIGLSRDFAFRDAVKLLQVGRDLFIRTGALTFFLAYTTRVATQIGPEAGAAHQAIRQVYVFTSLALDAYASTVQSLVGYFFGAGQQAWARSVVRVGTAWSLGTGILLGLLMWFGRGAVISFLVPAAAVGAFLPAWGISALTQPLSSLAFLSDGVHWGTSDYRYIRNAMLTATLLGLAGLALIDITQPGAFRWVWAVTGGWVGIRALFGMLRVFPGIGNSPWKGG